MYLLGGFYVFGLQYYCVTISFFNYLSINGVQSFYIQLWIIYSKGYQDMDGRKQRTTDEIIPRGVDFK